MSREQAPVVHNRDGHFLATLSALLLSLLEGKTDCPISGVFGAGKSHAAAAIIARLITVDPFLKIMILTKENSVPSICRTKQVIIGCGGGFRRECASKYSPIAQWMSEVDLALQDESQQYGNLDETAAIVRLPRNCIVLWLGDHRQTPGGLCKSIVARRFRQKLLRRPVALRGNSEKVQPNTLYKVVERYLTGTSLSPAYPMVQLMKPDPLSTQSARDQVEAPCWGTPYSPHGSLR